MLTWQTFTTPLGPVSMASDSSAVARVILPNEEHPEPTGNDHILERAGDWLARYFSGDIQKPTFPVAVTGTSFSHTAQLSLSDIPAGETRSYAWLAQQAGSPQAIRAAGTACATNPVPLVLPCHRIVRTDGSPGNYRGGTEMKTWLLEFERNHASGNRGAGAEV